MPVMGMANGSRAKGWRSHFRGSEGSKAPECGVADADEADYSIPNRLQ